MGATEEDHLVSAHLCVRVSLKVIFGMTIEGQGNRSSSRCDFENCQGAKQPRSTYHSNKANLHYRIVQMEPKIFLPFSLSPLLSLSVPPLRPSAVVCYRLCWRIAKEQQSKDRKFMLYLRIILHQIVVSFKKIQVLHLKINSVFLKVWSLQTRCISVLTTWYSSNFGCSPLCTRVSVSQLTLLVILFSPSF